MKKNFGIILAIVLGLSALLLTIAFQAGWVNANPFAQETRAGAPTIISYQGNIWDGETPHDGTGYFKFAIYDSKSNLTWSNDGNDPPSTAVELAVDNGLFSVNLGNAHIGMVPIGANCFDDPVTMLRVWFSPDDSNWTQLPDQEIAAVPYALQAQYATNADMLDNLHAANFQLKVVGSCPAGFAVRSISDSGGVTCEEIPSDPVLVTTDHGSFGSVGTYTNMDMVIGADGFGLVTYWDRDNFDLMVLHCKDLTCSTSDVSTLDSAGNVGLFPSIALAGDGVGLISYRDGSIGDLKVAHCDDLSCSSAYISVLDSTDDTGYGTSIAMDSNGYGLISYVDGTTMRLKLAHCGDPDCSTATINTVDSSTTAYPVTGIALGSDNLPIIAYIDQSENDLKVAHCNNENCDISTKTTIEFSGNFLNAIGPQVVIGSDGMAMIAYMNLSFSSAEIYFCYTIDCTSGYTFGGASQSGSTYSFALGSNDRGFIVNSDLSTVYANTCNNTYCVTSSRFAVGDAGLTTDHAVAVAIGTDGLPLIAYNNTNNDHLYVTHCSNELCIPINGDYLP